MRLSLIRVPLAAGLVIGSFAVPAASQDGATAGSAVFSVAQVERGQAGYEADCSSCHGVDLQGDSANALVGEGFVRAWTGLPLAGLFDFVRTMPPEAAASLGDRVYLDILSYVLHTNGFPSGAEDLRLDDLATVLLEGAEGPQEVPDHSLVQVVGCLTRGPDDAWIVTRASRPTRTRNPDASTGEARPGSITTLRGAAAFELLYVFPRPDDLEGHRVEVKGFLIRGDRDALNVTALSSLSDECR